MTDDMYNLQYGRQYMQSAEEKIRSALAQESPGQAAAQIVGDYLRVASSAEKLAFVAVLASRLAVCEYRLGLSPSGLILTCLADVAR
jgi:hypothetical protein